MLITHLGRHKGVTPRQVRLASTFTYADHHSADRRTDYVDRRKNNDGKLLQHKSLLITPQTGERKGKSQVKINTSVCCIDLVRLRRLAILGCLPFNAVYQMTKLVTLG